MGSGISRKNGLGGLFLTLLSLVAPAFSQNSVTAGDTLLDTDQAKVRKFSVPAGQSLSLSAKGGDAIVILGDPISWSEAAEDSEGDAEPGEPLFLTQGTRHLFYGSLGERTSFTLYQVDLKHHWATAMGSCDNPRRCVHAIKIGKRVLGEARYFFSNGEVDAIRYQLLKGGSLPQSYATAHASSDVLFVALSPLSATVDGNLFPLEAGQAHLFPKPQKIEVHAPAETATWVAIRIPSP